MMTGFLANPVFRSVDTEFCSHKTTKEAQLFEFDSEPWDVISAVSQRLAFRTLSQLNLLDNKHRTNAFSSESINSTATSFGLNRCMFRLSVMVWSLCICCWLSYPSRRRSFSRIVWLPSFLISSFLCNYFRQKCYTLIRESVRFCLICFPGY